MKSVQLRHRARPTVPAGASRGPRAPRPTLRSGV